MPKFLPSMINGINSISYDCYYCVRNYVIYISL